jgi:hypothetical protein
MPKSLAANSLTDATGASSLSGRIQTEQQIA